MFFGLFLAYILRSASAFLIRSYVHPEATCNTTAGASCFTELFQMMEETCTDGPLTFRCVHYTFLDECFEARVGKCPAATVGKFAHHGWKIALNSCQRKKKLSRAAEGLVPVIGRPRETMNGQQIVNSLGYLQVQCSLSRHKNCSSEHVHNIINQCEEHMKPKAGYTEYDYHRLLRIQLDISRSLIGYNKTDHERTCLIVRSVLSDLYSLHQAYCYHSIVTKCLCERMDFHNKCNIDCNHLEASSPNQIALAWDEWKRARLIRSSARPTPQDYSLVIFTVFLLFLF